MKIKCPNCGCERLTPISPLSQQAQKAEEIKNVSGCISGFFNFFMVCLTCGLWLIVMAFTHVKKSKGTKQLPVYECLNCGNRFTH